MLFKSNYLLPQKVHLSRAHKRYNRPYSRTEGVEKYMCEGKLQRGFKTSTGIGQSCNQTGYRSSDLATGNNWVSSVKSYYSNTNQRRQNCKNNWTRLNQNCKRHTAENINKLCEPSKRIWQVFIDIFLNHFGNGFLKKWS